MDSELILFQNEGQTAVELPRCIVEVRDKQQPDYQPVIGDTEKHSSLQWDGAQLAMVFYMSAQSTSLCMGNQCS